MHNPRLAGTALAVQLQELAETAHTVNQHRLPHRFCHFCLCQESGCLHRHIWTAQGIESTLAYCPYIRQLGVFAQLCHAVWPVGSDIPRMQSDGTSLQMGRHLARIAVEHKCLGGVGGNSMCVEIEHGDYQWNFSGTGS